MMLYYLIQYILFKLNYLVIFINQQITHISKIQILKLYISNLSINISKSILTREFMVICNSNSIVYYKISSKKNANCISNQNV